MKYKKSVYESLAMITQFGISMLVPIILCTFVGFYIGEKLSLTIMTVPFFFLGAIAGFRNIYYLSKKIFEQKDSDYNTSIRDIEDAEETKRTEEDK